MGRLFNPRSQVTLITAGGPGLPEHDTYCGATLLRVPQGDEANFLRRVIDFGQYGLGDDELKPIAASVVGAVVGTEAMQMMMTTRRWPI